MNKINLFLLLLLIAGCDYKKNLGDNYELVKTNGCCIFIFDKKARYKTRNKLTFRDNRIVQSLVSKSWHNKQIIVGLKEKNICCYLDKYEKENPNGYFIIDKKKRTLYDGLNKKDFLNLLKQYSVEFNKIDWN